MEDTPIKREPPKRRGRRAIPADRKRLFAQYFAMLGCASEAAKRVGYKPSNAATSGWRLRRDPEVLLMIEEEKAALANKANLSGQWVIERLRVEAETARSDSARVAALNMLARISGVYAPDVAEVKVSGDFFADVAAQAGGSDPTH